MIETIGYLLISFKAAKFFAVTFAIAAVLILFMYFIYEEHMPVLFTHTKVYIQLSYVFICLIIAGTPIFVSWVYQHMAIDACKQSTDCDYAKAYKAAQDLDTGVCSITIKE